jgi:hypothetical protein
MCPDLRRGGMLAGVGLVLDNHRLFSLTGSQALALIEDEIGFAQPSDGARSRPPVPATYLRIHRVCQRFQAICPWSCAHTLSAKIDLLKPKNLLFSMSQPSGERSNMPTDRKLGPDREMIDASYTTPCLSPDPQYAHTARCYYQQRPLSRPRSARR